MGINDIKVIPGRQPVGISEEEMEELRSNYKTKHKPGSSFTKQEGKGDLPPEHVIKQMVSIAQECLDKGERIPPEIEETLIQLDRMGMDIPDGDPEEVEAIPSVKHYAKDKGYKQIISGEDRGKWVKVKKRRILDEEDEYEDEEEDPKPIKMKKAKKPISKKKKQVPEEDIQEPTEDTLAIYKSNNISIGYEYEVGTFPGTACGVDVQPELINIFYPDNSKSFVPKKGSEFIFHYDNEAYSCAYPGICGNIDGIGIKFLVFFRI